MVSPQRALHSPIQVDIGNASLMGLGRANIIIVGDGDCLCDHRNLDKEECVNEMLNC